METSIQDVFRALNALTTFLIHTCGYAQLTQSAYEQEIRCLWPEHDKLWRDYNALCLPGVVSAIALRQLAGETLNFSTRLMVLNLKLNK